MKKFENYYFYYTKNVSAIVVPKSVKYIGLDAFGDSNIKKIYFAGDPRILGNIFPKTQTPLFIIQKIMKIGKIFYRAKLYS